MLNCAKKRMHAKKKKKKEKVGNLCKYPAFKEISLGEKEQSTDYPLLFVNCWLLFHGN